MRCFIIFISFFLFTKKELAQVVFCPPGAEWHYSFYVYLSNSYYNTKIKFVGDTIIGQDTLKVLTHNVYYNYCTVGSGPYKTLLHQKGDTVLFKNAATQNNWQILYNFAATTGQSWTTTICSFYNFSVTVTYTFTVDSIKTISLNNTPLKRLFLKSANSGPPSYFNRHLVDERIGAYGYLFFFTNPIKFSDCDVISQLLCYSDSTFGLKQFSEKSCDYRYTYYLGEEEQTYQNNSVHIYPNPTKDYIHVGSKNEHAGSSIITVTDLSGRTVKEYVLNLSPSESKNIDMSDLNKGIYLLAIRNNSKLIYTGKWVKD